MKRRKFEYHVHKNDRFFCVYHILDENGAVIYVGSSKNLHNRLVYHKAFLFPDFFSYRFFRCQEKDMSDFEAREIFNHHPFLNRGMPESKFYPHASYKNVFNKNCSSIAFLDIIKIKKIKIRYGRIRLKDLTKIQENIEIYTKEFIEKQKGIKSILYFIDNFKKSNPQFEDYTTFAILHEIKMGRLDPGEVNDEVKVILNRKKY